MVDNIRKKYMIIGITLKHFVCKIYITITNLCRVYVYKQDV